MNTFSLSGMQKRINRCVIWSNDPLLTPAKLHLKIIFFLYRRIAARRTVQARLRRIRAAESAAVAAFAHCRLYTCDIFILNAQNNNVMIYFSDPQYYSFRTHPGFTFIILSADKKIMRFWRRPIFLHVHLNSTAIFIIFCPSIFVTENMTK